MISLFSKLFTSPLPLVAALVGTFFNHSHNKNVKAEEQEPKRLTLDEIRAIKTKEEFIEKAFPSLKEPILPYYEDLGFHDAHMSVKDIVMVNSSNKIVGWLTYYNPLNNFHSYDSTDEDVKKYIKDFAKEYNVNVHSISVSIPVKNNETLNTAAKGTLRIINQYSKKPFLFNQISICDRHYKGIKMLVYIQKNIKLSIDDNKLFEEIKTNIDNTLEHECGHLKLSHHLIRWNFDRYAKELEADLWASVFAPDDKKQEARKTLKKNMKINETIFGKDKSADNYPTPRELATWLEKLEEIDPLDEA